ncbi:MAG: GNAT family N-acetyltransferase, partial [Candidatus Eremiobacteraeota bacterium]|nr:GNAT family N-acetyltransferase [Candidatus Eremiobacteraeota bacterium]
MPSTQGSSFTTELIVPPDHTFAALVEAFVRDAAERSGLQGRRKAGTIACARRGFGAIVGSALAQAREPIRIVSTCTPLHLTVSLFERGLPMDDAFARRDPVWNELLAHTDAVHWRGHGVAGSELRLVVDRPLGSPCGAAGIAPATSGVALAPEQEYEVRRFRAADAPGVARAFYLTYGYTYDFTAVYVPARLAELNELGRYVSIVAVTADGEIVGHYALAREGDEPIADACGAIVLPAHRGRNLTNRLRERVEREAISLGLAAYYSEPVTDHPRTQHASESFGAKPCGITLGEAPRGFIARHMDLSTTAQRQSCMLYVKPLQSPQPRTIYPPVRHRAIVERIYDQMAIPMAMRDGRHPAGSGVFHTAIARADRSATITVESVGATTPELLCQAAKDLRETRRLGAICASLPLEDPGTPALCQTMESEGF